MTKNIINEIFHGLNILIPILAAAIKEGYSIDELHELTNIDKWFLYKLIG